MKPIKEKEKQRKRTGLLQFHLKTTLKAIDMGQSDLWMSFLLISKKKKVDQRKRKAKKKKRLAPVSWKNNTEGHRHGPKRSVDELPLDQQNEKSQSKKKKSNEKEKACSNFMERHH